jgi:hypothetical protein
MKSNQYYLVCISLVIIQWFIIPNKILKLVCIYRLCFTPGFLLPFTVVPVTPAGLVVASEPMLMLGSPFSSHIEDGDSHQANEIQYANDAIVLRSIKCCVIFSCCETDCTILSYIVLLFI